MTEKKSFIRGALVGALTVLILTRMCVILTDKMGIDKDSKEPIVEVETETEGTVLTAETLEKIQTINQLIEQGYLFGDEISYDEMEACAIKGYVQGLGDPYTVYYDAEETKALMEDTAGEFGGIGVVITQNVNTQIITFTTVYEGSPGEKAGLKDGDVLYKVDGEDVSGQELDTVVAKIRGEKGTTVDLTVLRGEDYEEYSCTVTRDTIEVKTVAYKMLEGKIGYIAVSGFETITLSQFEKAIEDLNTQGMKKMIIDLRNNPGGNLSTVCDMLDIILPEGTIVYTEDKQNIKELFTSDEERQMDIPMAVLVNGNSASASEIFAGAIQDYQKGKIVGTTTFGKGIVQNIYGLPDGTSLKITISEYFTPNGRSIHGKGIEPDVVVEYQYDEANPEADNQLQAAIDCLK